MASTVPSATPVSRPLSRRPRRSPPWPPRSSTPPIRLEGRTTSPSPCYATGKTDMDTIGPYKILETLKGGRRPLYVVAGADGVQRVVKAAPLAELNPEERARFEREAEICATLDHPNLVRVIESGQTADLLYQIMERLEGSDFSKVFASGREFTWTDKLGIMD